MTHLLFDFRILTLRYTNSIFVFFDRDHHLFTWQYNDTELVMYWQQRCLDKVMAREKKWLDSNCTKMIFFAENYYPHTKRKKLCPTNYKISSEIFDMNLINLEYICVRFFLVSNRMNVSFALLTRENLLFQARLYMYILSMKRYSVLNRKTC